MRRKQIRNSMLLVITALIWGIAFVAQSEGSDTVGPFYFNFVRFLIGGVVLLPVIFLLDRKKPSDRKPKNTKEKKRLLLGGVSCGVVLFLASSVQQIGLSMGTPAGKAGFLTTCYILLVPILGLFFKKKCGWNIWVGIVITLIGLYLLCMTESFQFQLSDCVVLGCALLFAIHILVIDYFSPLVDGVRMSCIQFFVAGIFSAIPMFLIDMKQSLSEIYPLISKTQSMEAWIPILYAGFFSCGVAFTLQIIGQDGLNPTVASMLMSLESVFAVISSWLIQGETMGARQLMGCGFIFAAIILAQLPIEKFQRKKSALS